MEELEIEKEGRDDPIVVNEDKIERLARHEDAVLHNEEDVAELPKENFSNFLSQFQIFNLFPANKATIQDVDIENNKHTNDEICLDLSIKGENETQTVSYKSSDEEYQVLLNYLGLESHEVFSLFGKEVPIRYIDSNRSYTQKYVIDLPDNVAF